MHSYLLQKIARQTIGCLVAGAVAAAGALLDRPPATRTANAADAS